TSGSPAPPCSPPSASTRTEALRTSSDSTYAISVRGQETSTTHIDPDGHTWHVTVHWSVINGRSTPIGVDLRAFTGNDDQVRPTGGVLTAAVVRSLRIAEIIEDTREQAPRARPASRPARSSR